MFYISQVFFVERKECAACSICGDSVHAEGAFKTMYFSPDFWTFQRCLNLIDRCEVNRLLRRSFDTYQFGSEKFLEGSKVWTKKVGVNAS